MRCTHGYYQIPKKSLISNELSTLCRHTRRNYQSRCNCWTTPNPILHQALETLGLELFLASSFYSTDIQGTSVRLISRPGVHTPKSGHLLWILAGKYLAVTQHGNFLTTTTSTFQVLLACLFFCSSTSIPLLRWINTTFLLHMSFHWTPIE